MIKFIFAVAGIIGYSSFAVAEDVVSKEQFYYTNESVKICEGPTELIHLPQVRGEPYFLKYYSKNEKSRTYLTIVIWGRDIPNLEIDPINYFSSENRCIIGNISSYRGEKQLVVRSADQLTNK